MTKNRSLFPACPAVVFADIACLSAIYGIICTAEGSGFSAPFLPFWTLCAGLCFLVLLFLFRRGCDSSAVITACLIFFAIQCVLVYVKFGFLAGFLGIFMLLCAWGLSYYRMYSAFVSGIKPELLLDLFDGAAVLLVISALVVSVNGYPVSGLIPLLLALALLLSALISVRASSSFGRTAAGLRGRLFLIIAVTAAVAAAFVVIRYGGAGIKASVDFLVEIVRKVCMFVIDVIRRIFEFLSSLLPAEEYEELPVDMPVEAVSLEAQDYELDFDFPLYAVVAFLGALLAGGVIYGLLHSVKLNRLRLSGDRAVMRRKGSASGRLSELISGLKVRLKYLYCRIAYRNSARGLLAALDAVCSRRGEGRKDAESCRDFILRVSPAFPGCEDGLKELTDALDAELFGSSKSAFTADSASALRKKLRKAKNPDVTKRS